MHVRFISGLFLCTLVCSILAHTYGGESNIYQKRSFLLPDFWVCYIVFSLLKEKSCCFNAFTEILMMLIKPWMKSMTIRRTWDKFRICCQRLWEQQLILMRSLSLSLSLPPSPPPYLPMGTHACFCLTFSVLNRMNWKLNLRIWRGRSWRQSCLHLPQQLRPQLQCVYLLLSSPLGHLPRVAKLKMTSWQLYKQKWLCNYRYFSIFWSESGP